MNYIQDNIYDICLSNIIFIKKDDKHFNVIVEPINRGVAEIIANSIRRIILIYSKGCAISKFKINNCNSEFSILPGVKEDIFDFISNLKKIDVEIKNNNAQQTLYFKNNQNSIVTLTDFKNHENLIIYNNEIILHTNPNCLIEIELIIERNIGYIPSSSRKKQFFFILNNNNVTRFIKKKKIKKKKINYNIDLELKKNNFFYLDVNFNPIKNVGYSIEMINNGTFIGKERLILNIATNGVVDIRNIISNAFELLIKQFLLIKRNIFLNNELYKNYLINLNIKFLRLNKNLISQIKYNKISDFIQQINYLNFNNKNLCEIKFSLFYFKITFIN